MTFKRFEDMTVWKEGRELVKAVYALTRVGDFARDWGLRDQIQRAAVSVPSNIAEGHARRGNKELVKFLWIAKGSAAEVQSQLYSARDLGYVDSVNFDSVYNQTNLIQVHLYHLIETLSAELARNKPISQPSQPSQPSQHIPTSSNMEQ